MTPRQRVVAQVLVDSLYSINLCQMFASPSQILIGKTFPIKPIPAANPIPHPPPTIHHPRSSQHTPSTMPPPPPPPPPIQNQHLPPLPIPTAPRRLHPIEHTPNPPFTPTQRALQARAKDHDTLEPGSKRERDALAYEVRARREQAARILESGEMVIWWSGVRNEVRTSEDGRGEGSRGMVTGVGLIIGQSITQTRMYFQNVVWGVEEGDVVWREEWDVDGERERGVVSPRGKGSGKEREREREKGKRRVSGKGGG